VMTRRGRRRKPSAGRAKYGTARLPRGAVQTARRIWTLVGAFAVLAGLLGIPTLWSMWLGSTAPNVEVRWYATTGSASVLCPPGIVADPPDPSIRDLDARRVRLPIQLAIANRDGRRLSDVRIVLKFGPSVTVASVADEAISSQSGLREYEHSIGTLEATDTFHVLKTVDTLSVGVDSLLACAFRTMGADVPEYIEFLRTDTLPGKPQGTLTIAFTLELLAAGRKPISFEFRIPGQIVNRPWWPPRIGVITGRVTPDLRARWRTAFASSWDSTTTRVGWFPRLRKQLRFREGFDGRSHYVAYKVQGVPKRMDVDIDGDGFVDAVLADTLASGHPNVALRPAEAMPMKIPKCEGDEHDKFNRIW
jgi:hypothetical protein